MSTKPRGPALPHFKTPEEERRYWLAMADLAAEVGRPELSRAYGVAAKDCPPDCTCNGCVRVRDEVAEITAARKSKSRRRTA